ncbi:Membrane-bound metal-dependent hydrolase [Croceitalea dokdonensis DOKDO 023]|uniref:Membrane-bound metal-dependent hydrolase n=1 Tax=Croceitalea dokdonensis DOKDO 023 TaxID=1300341 RepID=A0A0P7AXP4_9FLAO|nr:metal-dependent hydrolase [Croceitalea dokdonensis]KPM33581.1 Membrane-bound metal-dependent hydrolase [Croceitalea dokdonensis DOKDO 023]
MDSLTQIVLGAAVGEAVLGKRVGNKAPLWGAIAGTIPDLDVVTNYMADTVTAIEVHRGFSHSLFFSIVFAPLLGWLVWNLYHKKQATWRDWSTLFFWGLFTHPILDAFTTWGTQLFWPLQWRLAFQSIFVIDPLYTLPFLIFLILAIRQSQISQKRRKLNRLGIIISSCYLLATLGLKALAHQKFITALQQQGISYSELDTRPAPMNTILWMANIDTKDAYLIGEYSFFDSQEITFRTIPKNHELLEGLQQEDKVKRLIKITQGWYAIHEKDGQLFFNDLRFGLLSLNPKETQFAFSYQLQPTKNGLQVHEVPKLRSDGKKLLSALWERIWGN